MKQRRVHYVLSSHWDREWYQPFQDLRYRLIMMLDEVFDGFTSGELRGPFQTDGQAVMLEDYLEVRPERREVVERMAGEGKLIMGPWYVLPDEFLVSGESLIRNLERGHYVARSLGGAPSKAGFLCDLFGHISQLPQILRGFGIETAFLWRGTNQLTPAHFRWKGANGSQVYCYRFGRGAYGSPSRKAHEYDFDRAPDDVVAAIDEQLEEEGRRTKISDLLMLDGADHQHWDREFYDVLMNRYSRQRTHLAVTHSSLDSYSNEMLAERTRIKPRVGGELREPGRYSLDRDAQWLIPGVLSSRVWIKQANALCQNLLCYGAEPLSVLSRALTTHEYPTIFINLAWKWLLQNQPHDSICGCSIDAVHEDMEYRFRQARQISRRLITEALLTLCAAVTGNLDDADLRLIVFNPIPRKRSQVVELTVPVPTSWPQFSEFFGYEGKPSFRIFDPDGKEIPYQRLSQEPNSIKLRTWPTRGYEEIAQRNITIALPLELPAMGYTTLTVKPSKLNPLRTGGSFTPAVRFPKSRGVVVDERTMQNEFILLTFEASGILTLFDKRTGHRYERLMTFEERADIGDGWYHGVATNDATYASTASNSQLIIIHDGPFQGQWCIRTTMEVPSEFDFSVMRRSDRRVSITIENFVTLRRGADRVELRTVVQNTATDHRFRVLFPSGCRATTYLTDSAFDVIRRPIMLRKNNHEFRELEVETKPQQSWTAVYKESRGLAVITSGLMESTVRDSVDRPIILTLFRGTRRTVGTNGEPGGQILGKLEFLYWLVPLADAPDRIRLFDLSTEIGFGFPSESIQNVEKIKYKNDWNNLPKDSLVEVTGSSIITAMRQRDNGVEIRLFNPLERQSQSYLTLNSRLKVAAKTLKVWETDLLGNTVRRIRVLARNKIALTLSAKQILTLMLQPTDRVESARGLKGSR